MAMSPLSHSPNLLFAQLTAADLALLQPHLEQVDLPLRRQLETARRPVQYAYFPDSGIASVVAKGARGLDIEVGLVGCEGFTGLPIVLGTQQSPHDTFVQLAGSAQRIAAPRLLAAIEASGTLLQVLLRFVHVFAVRSPARRSPMAAAGSRSGSPAGCSCRRTARRSTAGSSRTSSWR